MDGTPQRTFVNIDSDPDPRSSPPHIDHRTQLNNWLQVNGGPGRLDWTCLQDGPGNNQNWVVICLSESPCELPWSLGRSNSTS